MATKFYVENAKDRWGNRSFPAAVIEGAVVDGEYFKELVFKAPESIVSRWPSTYYRPDEWTEVEGPAQMLGCWEDCDKYIEEHALDGQKQKLPPMLKNGTSEVRELVTSTCFLFKA